MIDLVFVHGLDGSPQKTWSGQKGFWPMWLKGEAGFENVRILRFGYHAEWASLRAVPNNNNIQSFASELLDALDTHHFNYGVVRPLPAKFADLFRQTKFLLRIVWVG